MENESRTEFIKKLMNRRKGITEEERWGNKGIKMRDTECMERRKRTDERANDLKVRGATRR